MNTTTNLESEDNRHIDRTDIFAVIFRLFFLFRTLSVPASVVGIIGNTITFYSITKYKQQTTTLLLCRVLALVDTAVLISFGFITVDYTFDFLRYCGIIFHYEFVKGYIWYIGNAFVGSNVLATIWVTVLLGINRYIIVCYHLHASRICTLRRVQKAVFCIALIGVANGILVLFNFKVMHVDVETPLAYNILPLVILSFVTVKLILGFRAILKSRSKILSVPKNHDNNVTFALIVVLITFEICQLPTFIVFPLSQIAPNVVKKVYLQYIGMGLQILNSSVIS